MPSMKENSKHNDENLAEIQITISRLSTWLKRDVGVPEKLQDSHIDSSGCFIERIYEFSKHDYGRAERYLYKYYKMRCGRGVSEIFHQRNSDSDEILKSCQSVYFFTLPQLTKKGHRIIFMKIAPFMSVDDFEPKALFKRFFMVSDIRFNEEKDNRKDVFILDMDGFTRQHAVKLFNGGFITKFLKCLQEIYPRRIHAIHLIRTKPWHKSTLNVWLKMCGISKKMASKIKTHSIDEEEMEGLDGQLQQLSGKMQDLNDAWTQKLIMNGSWFESQDVLFMSTVPKNIKLPPLKLKSQDEEDLKIKHHSEIYVFESLEGSFKKLDT